jgi:hypothetical protein
MMVGPRRHRRCPQPQSYNIAAFILACDPSQDDRNKPTQRLTLLSSPEDNVLKKITSVFPFSIFLRLARRFG